jgi:hypothetical protein
MDLIFFTFGEQLCHAFLHFPCSLVGEGDRKDIVWHHTFLQKKGNSVCDNACLAGSSPGKNQHRAMRGLNRFSLLRIEFCQPHGEGRF